MLCALNSYNLVNSAAIGLKFRKRQFPDLLCKVNNPINRKILKKLHEITSK